MALAHSAARVEEVLLGSSLNAMSSLAIVRGSMNGAKRLIATSRNAAS